MKLFEKVLFIVTFFVAFLGILHLIKTFVTVYLIVAIFSYLFAGWYFLFPIKKEGASRIVPFIVSYMIAQTLISIVLGINDWPLREMFSYVTIVMVLITIGIMAILKKSLSINYPIGDYLIKLIICFLFSGTPLWMWL